VGGCPAGPTEQATLKTRARSNSSWYREGPRVSLINGLSCTKESRAWPGTPDSHPSWRPQAMGVLSAIPPSPPCPAAVSLLAGLQKRRSYVLSTGRVPGRLSRSFVRRALHLDSRASVPLSAPQDTRARSSMGDRPFRVDLLLLFFKFSRVSCSCLSSHCLSLLVPPSRNALVAREVATIL
jgi:hypothetical protein